ncbi:MAG TPA: exosortase system-associated protein, TIGR04073 family [Verrucomicrobiae bacterium]|jgi:putative exosortase-associated protein (TIGR04073 family)|nr:exosortase system-associated protein, TIGR04073 family [Verrucomicrobiae bacterium]
MRNIIPFLAIAVLAGLFTSGCAGPEEKLGRGMRNSFEIVRMGEMRRTIEQTSIFDSPEIGSTTGVIRGFDRSMARTGLGLVEIATFPIPPYDPQHTKYLAPEPVYPDSYKPGLAAGSTLDTDTYTGFSGGTILPWIPGNRFRVFDN